MANHNPRDQWLRHTFQQAPWRMQMQTTSLVLAVVVLVGVVGALYLAQASRTAGAGRRLQALEAERQRLEQQNSQLRAEIAAQRSVPRLIAEAQALGYHPARSPEVEYLLVENVPPLAAPTATPQPELEEVVPPYDETLEGWLAEQLVSFRGQFSQLWQGTFGDETPEPPEDAPPPTPTPVPPELFESFPELAPTAVQTSTPASTVTAPAAEEATPDA